MNGVPGALQNRDPACRARQVNSTILPAVPRLACMAPAACRARQVNSRHLLAVSTILTRFLLTPHAATVVCRTFSFLAWLNTL